MIEKADASGQSGGRWANDAAGPWEPDARTRAGAAVRLRPARPEDQYFAAALYLDSMRRLLSRLGKWDEDRVKRRFRESFRLSQTQIIDLGDADIGWIQVSETAEQFHLHQIHLVQQYRNRGIGGALIAGLLRQAQAEGRPVVLNVIHGNPAASLYARLGFRPVREDAEKLLMRWEPERSAGGAAERLRPAVDGKAG